MKPLSPKTLEKKYKKRILHYYTERRLILL